MLILLSILIACVWHQDSFDKQFTGSMPLAISVMCSVLQVRAAAATTMAMLLEGAPQRSYMGIAELTSSRLHQPVR